MKKLFFLISSLATLSLAAQTVTTTNGSGSAVGGYVPRFNSSTNVVNSNIYQNGPTNVGFGTTTPTAPLHIQASSSAGYGILLNQTGNGQSGINLWNTNTTNPGRNWGLWSTGAGNSGGAGNFIIQDVTATQSRLFISGSTGYIGIGTNAPTALLNVNGNVLIGDPANVTLPTGYKLYVQTGILTEKVKVALTTDLTNWADYVFDENYKLKTIEEVDGYIKENKHLPGVPSTKELIEQGGIDLAKMDAKLMEKIEELTLYIIDLKKEIDILKKEKK